MRTRFAAPLALACGIALANASAQPIYRCGDSYGSQPCAGARAIAPDAVSPSDAERRQAAVAAQRDAQLAEGLEKERLRQEARPPSSAYIPSPAPEPVHPPHKWPEKAATRKLDVFTATGPAPARKEKAARRGKAGAAKGAAKTKAKADAAVEDKKKAPAGRLAKPDAR